MTTLSQSYRKRLRRLNWAQGDSFWAYPWMAGESDCCATRRTTRNIHVSWFATPRQMLQGGEPLGITYTFDRAEWEEADDPHRTLLVERETCWCWRKAESKILGLRDFINHALARIATQTPARLARTPAG